jgi:uncharacterized protein (TIGR02001 family)
MKTKYTIALMLIFSLILTVDSVYAQVEVGVDISSRYVWRGTDFGASPSIQPEISYTVGGLTIGSWAAMATNGNPAGSEIDFFLSYAIPTSFGDLELVVTDYTFPEDPTGAYFSSSSHFIELGAGFSGNEKLPISFFTGVFVTNDDDYSIYSELGYSVGSLDLMLGFTPAASDLYDTRKAGIIAAGVGTTREIKVTDYFSFGLTGTVMFNPYQENAFFLVGISF